MLRFVYLFSAVALFLIFSVSSIVKHHPRLLWDGVSFFFFLRFLGFLIPPHLPIHIPNNSPISCISIFFCDLLHSSFFKNTDEN